MSFIEGKKKYLITGGSEAPVCGHDIEIGEGRWIASGAILVGGRQDR